MPIVDYINRMNQLYGNDKPINKSSTVKAVGVLKNSKKWIDDPKKLVMKQFTLLFPNITIMVKY